MTDLTRENTMCRFVAVSEQFIYTTDMGLGCCYVTDVKSDKTVAVDFHKSIKNVLGIVVDPVTNQIFSFTQIQ